jgi:hypothetical protein
MYYTWSWWWLFTWLVPTGLEALAENTPGVRDVDDRLRVGPPATDTRPRTSQPLPETPT